MDLHALKEELKEDMKNELKDLKQEIYQKLSVNSTRSEANETRLNEAEARINETESANMAMKEALIKSMDRQKTMQEKLTLRGGLGGIISAFTAYPKGKKVTPCPTLWSNF